MKKVSIGHIARNGGLSRFIDEATAAKEPLVLIRNNKPTAVFLPYHAQLESMLENLQAFGETLARFEKEGLSEELRIYLVNQVLAGVAARLILSNENVDTMEAELVRKFREQFTRG